MRVERIAESLKDDWTVKKIVEMVGNETINSDVDIQRGYVWDNDRKSAMIRSAIIGFRTMPITFNKVADVFCTLDGKQRIDSFVTYINEEFALSGIESVNVINDNGELEEVDINGLKFSELDECMQDAIKSYCLTVNVYDDLPRDIECEIFYYLNNGKMLNAATLNRVKARALEDIIDLGNHEVFAEALTDKAMVGHVNEDLVAKAHIVLHEAEPSLETKFVRPYVKDMKISADDKKVMAQIFTRIKNIHDIINEEDPKIAKRVYTRTHFISIVPLMKATIITNEPDAKVARWAKGFYAGKKSASVNELYNSAAGSGSGKKEAVRKRLSAVSESWREFTKKEREEALED